MADELPKLQRQIRQLAVENVGLREAAGRSDVERRQLHDELEALRSEYGAAMREITSQRDEIRRLRVRLDRILASPPAKAYNAVRRLPGVRRDSGTTRPGLPRCGARLPAAQAPMSIESGGPSGTRDPSVDDALPRAYQERTAQLHDARTALAEAVSTLRAELVRRTEERDAATAENHALREQLNRLEPRSLQSSVT